MTPCEINGCRNLQTTCADCGRMVCEKILPKGEGWISVEDAFPENKQSVLCYGCYSYDNEDWNVYPSIYQANYLSIGYWEVVNEMSCIMEVTHWMPLPKPPKE